MRGTNPRDWRNPSYGQVPPHNHRRRGAHQPGSFPRHHYGAPPGHPPFPPDPYWNPEIGAPGHPIPGGQLPFNPQGYVPRNPEYHPVNPQYSPRNSNYPQVNRVGPPSYRCTSPRCPSPSQEFRPPYRSPIQNINNSRVNPGSSVPQTSRNLHESTDQLQALDISSNSSTGYRSQAQNVSDTIAGPEKKRMKTQRDTIGISTPAKGSAVNQGETTTLVLTKPAASNTSKDLASRGTEGFAISSRPSSTSQQPPLVSEIYSAEQKYFLRLISIHINVSKNVLHRIYVLGHKRFLDQLEQTPKPTLFEYYETKRRDVEKIFKKKMLNEIQRSKILSDPKGFTFDVTLLFNCIQYGSDGIEHDPEKWKENQQNLESYITSIKNARNYALHNMSECDKKSFIDETNRLGELYENVFESARKRYPKCCEEIEEGISRMQEELIAFRDKPFHAQNLEDYMKEVPLEEFSEFVNVKGNKELCEQYESMKRSIITPVNHLAEIVSFHVRDIYTQMVLKETMSQDIKLENVLQNSSKDGNKHLYLLEGIAGVGKTTLSKKILEDWMHPEKSTIEDLYKYSILLHTECRNRSNPSFLGLIQGLMPNLSRRFKPEDFQRIVLCQRILVLFDGLDEINEVSAKLFQEILDLKESHRIDVMVTTRPEKVKYYLKLTRSLHLETKHIELLGIPKEKREDFVYEYYSKIKKVSEEDSLDKLLDYLSRTQHRLDDLWRLPYNLALLVILWVNKSSVVNTITTASELYWEIHLLCISKLEERLSRHYMTRHLNESSLAYKVDCFIKSLSKEALVGLVEDNINLGENSLYNLLNICLEKDIPDDEMIGAFLKKTTTTLDFEDDIRFSYPHKGLQDFLGALHIFYRFQDEWKNCENDVVIKDYFAELHGTKPMEITKFQNLLIILIGVIYLHQYRRKRMIKVNDIVKRHILDLLKDTEISSADSWLKILDSVKCDEFVAKYISQISGILSGQKIVNDSSIFAYASLLSALPDSESVEKDFKMHLDLQDNAGISEILPHISRLRIPVDNISFMKDVMKFSPVVPYEDALNEIFQNAPQTMKNYLGPITPTILLSTHLQNLTVSIADKDGFKSLNSFLKVHETTSLSVCFRKCFNWRVLEPLPYSKIHQSTIHIVGIDSEEAVQNAWDIIKALRPTDGKNSRKSSVVFPDIKMTAKIMRTIVRGLKKGLDIKHPLLLPENCGEYLTRGSKLIKCVAESDEGKLPINEKW